MNKHTVTLLCLLACLSVKPIAIGQPKLQKIKVDAPFKMPAITIPDFATCARISITDFGAIAGNKEKNTKAIHAAISAANKANGGVVIIPKGEWITGKINLKSNVNLHLEEGAVLLFSENPEDYLPPVLTSWEGLECLNYSPMIYAYACKNIAISGKGELKAKMDIWKKWFSRPKAHMESIKQLYNWAAVYLPVNERNMVNDTAHLRPQFIQFNRCTNVLMEGVQITNSPFWTIHPFLSKNVVIRNIHIVAHGHNNDGIDPEMCTNVWIDHCEFDQGDDAIAIKSGRNPEGWRLKTPSKNIVVSNCYVKNGHQLVAIGSEVSGGIQNVYIKNCTVAENAKLNHLLFIKTNERMGGFIKNIYADSLTAHKVDLGIIGIETDVLYQWRNLVPTTIKKLTPIKHIYLSNIQTTDARFISRILGQKMLPVNKVTLLNIKVNHLRDKEHIHENVTNFLCNGCDFTNKNH